jgi:hypothetical protein
MSQTALRDASIFLPVAEAIRLGGGPAKLAAAISAITPDQSIKGNVVRQWPLKRRGIVPVHRARAVSVFSTCQIGCPAGYLWATGILEDVSERTAGP